MRWLGLFFAVGCGTSGAALDAPPPREDHHDRRHDDEVASTPPADAPSASETPAAPWARCLAKGLSGRDYELVLDPSAMYTITQLAQPNDQLDWNKLPGISDCGTFRSRSRWRDVWMAMASRHEPEAARDHRVRQQRGHAPHASVADDRPRRYRFSISGTIRGRAIDAAATLPRRCGTTTPSSLVTAPSKITARIFEHQVAAPR